MSDLIQRIFSGVILTMVPFNAKTEEDESGMTAGTILQWTSNDEDFDGELVEEIIGQDGLLSIHAPQRSQGGSYPEPTLYMLYGGIYMGDFNDLVDVPFTILCSAEFARSLGENYEFFDHVGAIFHAGNYTAKMDAIAEVY